MRYDWICYYVLIVGIAVIKAVSLSTPQHIYKNESALLSTTNIFPNKEWQINKYTVATSRCTTTVVKKKKECLINTKKLAYDHALIINATDHTNFIYPNENGTIILEEDQHVFLACPGQDNIFKNIPESQSFSNFTCICGTAFSAYNSVYDFDRLTCKLPPKYDIVDKGFYGRESEYRKFEIGFRTIADDRFLKIIDVHYDRSTTSTMYVKSVVSRFIAGSQKSAKQHQYDQTHCCERQRNRLDMDAIYNAKTQDRSFAAQLYCHDSEFHTRCSYLSESSAIIFNRCQLSPRSSFVYTSASAATFAYLNTGPQWRPINDGNWARIEDHVLEIAKELRKDLTVYTGVYDRLRLKDTGDGNKEKLIFLYASANNDKSISIPLYFWKIIFEPESKRGIAYVTVNNPYLDRGEDYHLCEKPMFSKDGAQMPKQWKPKNIAKGYSYFCEVTDFMRNSAITFSDFSITLAQDLLYLPKNRKKVTTV